ncbi:uncharacterized protein [Periplaneta americana]|uniref:uncharacterized protein n=1 Tax=Periplaneta americana TaxID=6978 RepID=UPI0037E73E3E
MASMWTRALSLVLVTIAITIANTTSLDLVSLPRGLQLSRSGEFEGNCTPTGNACKNCTAAPLCLQVGGDYMHFGSYSCAQENASTPYCVAGKCSSVPSKECAVPPVSNFRCTGEGYFPDPDDCTLFHICVKGTAYQFSCNSQNVYSHSRAGCVRRRLSSDCAVMRCTYKSLNEYVVYSKDASLYGMCLKGFPTLVFRCPKGEQFDSSAKECRFKCSAEGLFPAANSNSKYYECIYISVGNYELIRRECPSKITHFDPVAKRCVPNV